MIEELRSKGGAAVLMRGNAVGRDAAGSFQGACGTTSSSTIAPSAQTGLTRTRSPG